MKLPVFHEGMCLLHPERGPCKVEFVGSDYVGVELRSGATAMLLMTSFVNENGSVEKIGYQAAAGMFWPDSTFVFETSEARSPLASRWHPFFDDEAELMARLPEIVPQGNPWIGYGEIHESSRKMPIEWLHGVALTSPNQRQGLIMFIRMDPEDSELIDVFPFFSTESHYTLKMQRVMVRPSGIEANIEVLWGRQKIAFFDVGFLVNRLWYQTDKTCEFNLSGLAYQAWPVDSVGTDRGKSADEARDGKRPHLSMDIGIHGESGFQAAENGDIDDYNFRGVVREVNAVRGDILGQTGWVASVAVMAGLIDAEDDEDDEAACLDILITRRAWQGETPPAEGQMIEGRCWLQGYLRYAAKEKTEWHRPASSHD